MAPASSAGAMPGGRRRWDRAQIIEAITEWVALYGEPPRAADWNPSAARWAGAPWRIERYRRGRPDGTPWPSLNAAKRPFGGSLTAAVAAAGYGTATGTAAPERCAPAGPGELATALRRLARARAETDDAAMRRALTDVAEAAMGWRGQV